MSINIQIPGSKSITNRAILLAALSQDEVILENALICDDSLFMVENLKKLGIKIQQKRAHGASAQRGEESGFASSEPSELYKIMIKVKGNGGNFEKSSKILEFFCGNAGTTTRFLTALATISGNEIIIDGDERMKKRPIKELVDALNQLGAEIKTTNDYLPLLISPKKLSGGKINLPGNISSQFLSALLMTCPFAENDTEINIDQKLYSRPYVEMTIELLNAFGILVTNKNFERFEVKGKQKSIFPHLIYKIESDASSASYIGAYAALHPQKEIILQNIPKKSLQGDIKFIEYLKKMGCQITDAKEGITIKGPKELKSIGEIDMNETPDLVMTFAILAVFTEGPTKITNIENLRVKESDRISALKKEIKKLGINVKTGKDFIEIKGRPEIRKSPPLEKILINTYNDHRMAMSFAILRDLIPNLKIENPECVKKSYPYFWEDLTKLENG